MSKKIRVLVTPSDKTGVGKFRSIDPHVMLQNNYGDDFHVDIDYEPKLNDPNYWKQYDIVHFHRSIGQDYNMAPNIIKYLNSVGIVTIMDLDDYWLPTKEHPVHQLVLQHKLHEKIIENLKVAQHVTTTTSIFATEISKYNKNVYVLPNAINPKEPQFQAETLPSDKLRFGWLGGSSHLHDLKLLDGTISKLTPYKDKFSMYLCGFDIRGTVTEINKETGEQKQRDILPQETVWARYEEIFTNNHKMIDDKHKDFLMKFKDEEYNSDILPFYNRIWTKPVTSYAANYRWFDVSLAPIKNHIFNRVKSQLKVIEAGFYKKAIIASNVGPYTLDLKHALKNGEFTDGNSLLVDENRNHSDWSKYMKKLIDNPNWAYDLGQRLYETVKDTYDLNKVTKDADQFEKYFDWFQKRFPEDVGMVHDDVFIKRGALVPEFAKIVCVSMAFVLDNGEVKKQTFSGDDEKELLVQVRNLLDRCHKLDFYLCGHNLKNFDIPMLAKRMIINGIMPSKLLPSYDTKPWEVKAIDTKEVWQYGAYSSIGSLDLVCSTMGIPTPKDGEVTGDKVHHAYWVEQKLTEISEYCEKDVDVLIQFIKKLKELK